MPNLLRHTKGSSPIVRPTRMVRGLLVLTFIFIGFITVGSVASALAIFNPPLFHAVTGNLFNSEESSTTVAEAPTRSRVLGESIANPLLQFNIPATFTAALTAAELNVQGNSALNGPVTAGQTLTVSGVSTFNDDVIVEGNLLLNQDFVGNGVNIDVGSGTVTGSNLVYSITEGAGIAVTGDQEVTIENTDRGSDQKIFRTIQVGSDTLTAGSNTDTVTFAAGEGVTIGMDAGNKKLTISASGGDSSAAIGDRDYTDSLVLTDSQTVTASLDALNVAIGNRSYTGANNLTSGQSITASLLALDTAIANSGGGHDPITLAGSYDYVSLSGQVITLGQVDLATDVTGTLPVSQGGTGATTLNNLITLGTHTTGNYIATIADAGSSIITVTGSGSESAAVTLTIAANSLDFTQFKDTLALDASTSIGMDGAEDFTISNGGTGNFIVDLTSSGDFVIKDNGSAYATFSDAGNLNFTGTMSIVPPAGIRQIAYTLSGTGSSGAENGTIHIDNTSNDGHALTLYSNKGAANGALMRITANNSSFDKPALWLINNGTAGSASGLRIDGPRPEIEFWETDQTSPAGAFELRVNSDVFQIGSRKADDSGFEYPFTFQRQANGGNFGIGTSSPQAMLAVGSTSQFRVNSSGAITAATGITSSGTITLSGLSTDGLVTVSSGVLSSTATLGASYITADALDFTEFKDALTLDASTDIAITGTNVFSLTNTGTGFSFRVNDESGDTSPFVISDSGAVGIGTTNPTDGSAGNKLAIYDAQYARIYLRATEPASDVVAFIDARGDGTNTVQVGSANAHPISFYTNNTRRMLLDTSGGLRVGSINDLGSATGTLDLEAANASIVLDSINANPASRLAIKFYEGAASMSLSYDGAGAGDENKLFIRDESNNTDVITFTRGGSIGIGTTAPTVPLAVGSTSQFRVNSSGAIAAATGITSSGTITFSGLSTDGIVTVSSGALGSISTFGASYITADSLDFTEFKDAMTLDASTDIAITGTNVFSLTNTGTGFSFRVNDQSSDTTPFVITQDGNVGIGVSNGLAGQKVHIGDGNLLFEGGGETAMIFKRGVTFTGGVSGTAANPIFQMGRIVQAGDGDPEIRFLYSDDSTAERSILEFDRKGIVSSVKEDVGSFFEGHIAGDTHPFFRLNSYPNMRLEMGAGGASDTDVAIARTGTQTIALLTGGTTRMTLDASGNVGIGTTSLTNRLTVYNAGATNTLAALTGTNGSYSTGVSLKSGTGVTWNILSQENFASNALLFGQGGTYGLSVQTGGNVGVGTTAATQALDVNGKLRVRGNELTDSGDTTRVTLGSTTTLTNSTLTLSGTTTLTATSLDTFNCSDCINFDDFADSASLDTNFAVNQAGNTWTQSYTGTSTTGFTYNANSLTSASGVAINANALTTGKGIDLQSTSTALTTGSLANFYWNPGSATTATGDLFKLDIGANASLTGNLLALYNNSASVFRVSTSQINSDVPHSFNAAGDVSMAYDLIFTNQSAATIGSNGPLTIAAGEAFENNDLNLLAYGTGKINLINSGLGLQTSEKIIFDTDDASDSYLSHSNSGNYLSIFTDGTEAARFNSSGSVDGNTTFNANAFDLAEYYPTKDTGIEAGDIVSIALKSEADEAATEAPYLVAKTEAETMGQVLGVVSTKPGFALGGGTFRSEMCSAVLEEGGEEAVREQLIAREKELLIDVAQPASPGAILSNPINELSDAALATIEDKISTCKALSNVPIALAGRVPVKVDIANAADIKTGDLLMPSPVNPGKAIKATEAGWVIGRALEDYTPGNDTVMTFVFTTYYNGGSGASLASVSQHLTPVELSDDIGDVLGVGIDNSGSSFIVAYANFDVVGDIITNTITATNQVVTGSITIDGQTGSLSTAADTVLKLQDNTTAGAVDIFNGKIIFNTDGEIITLSDIQAKLIGAERFAVTQTKDNNGKDNSSVGIGTLKSGSTQVEVSNSSVKKSDKIFVTPRNTTKGQMLYVSAVNDGSFTVSIDTALNSNVQFDYWILGVL